MDKMKEMMRLKSLIARDSGPMADAHWKAVWTETEALLQQVATLELRERHRAIHHDAAMRSLQSRHTHMLRQLLKAVELAQYGTSVQKQHVVDYQLEVMHDDITKAIGADDAT